jgi:hypothetical protein
LQSAFLGKNRGCLATEEGLLCIAMDGAGGLVSGGIMGYGLQTIA